MPNKSIGYDEELTRLSVVAYSSYAEVTSSTDEPVPEWQNLSLKEREAWQRVVLSLSKEFQYV